MARLILLRGAKQLLTLRGPSGVRRGAALHDLGIIEDGSVLIRDGIIAAVGSTRRIENLKEAQTALEISAQGRVVMPAFIDAGLNLSVGKQPASPGHIMTRKERTVFYDETLALLRSCLQHGTLRAEVKLNGTDGDFRSSIPAFRQIVKMDENPIETTHTWKINSFLDGEESSVSSFHETIATLAKRKLAHFVEVVIGSDHLIDESIFAAIKDADLGLKFLWQGKSPEVLADLVSRFKPRSVSCPTCLGSSECSVLSNSESIVVFAPASKAFEEPGAIFARHVADSGGAVALCTDYDFRHPASSSMQMAISLAVSRLKLTPEEAITASTINAAHATGYGHITGSLEFQKRADVLILHVPDYREIPRRFGMNHVDMAIRNGEIVFNRTPWKVSTDASNL
ncbi:MAG: amidohydrolase family protein [Acidobacteriaceae bacterium]|nr:amidohydrolase family protein [Acidobacteriaceae bacterium]MBV9765736.1 amidohydrolase family protein [Acidobacteriaceae bacterium]